MQHSPFRHVAGALLTITVVAAALWWSWNTVASLTGWPPAGFRHALAAAVIVLLLRFSGRRCRGVQCQWHD